MSTSLATHARTIAGDLSDLTRALIQGIALETHEFVLSAAQAKSPRRTGALAAKWQSVPANVAAAVENMQPTKVRNVSPQALVIDMGRRKSQNAWSARSRKGTRYTVKAGKMLGSEQAPRGMKGPALRELAAQEDAIFDRARARAEQKVRPR